MLSACSWNMELTVVEKSWQQRHRTMCWQTDELCRAPRIHRAHIWHSWWIPVSVLCSVVCWQGVVAQYKSIFFWDLCIPQLIPCRPTIMSAWCFLFWCCKWSQLPLLGCKGYGGVLAFSHPSSFPLRLSMHCFQRGFITSWRRPPLFKLWIVYRICMSASETDK